MPRATTTTGTRSITRPTTTAQVGTEVISDNEFWGFEDYGANLLAKYAPGGALEYYAGWDYQHYSGEDQVFLIAPLAETVHAPFAQIRTSREFSDSVRLSFGARHNDPSHGQSATVWTATSHWDISDSLFTRASLGRPSACRMPTNCSSSIPAASRATRTSSPSAAST